MWLIVGLLFMLMKLLGTAVADPLVPCFFIFGDSLVDNGNNNDRLTLAKSNYPPYGIDFPNGPTGRFTNGRTAVDFLAELMGFNGNIPPNAKAKGSEILKGVNYASGSGGIRPETGKIVGDCIELGRQMENFRATIKQLGRYLGKNVSTAHYLNKCVFYLGMGNNDYLVNYYLPLFYPTSRNYTPQQYATDLIERYKKEIENMYNEGARKLALAGIAPIGCTPYARSQTKNGTCVKEMNTAIELFNVKLRSLVDEYNTILKGAKFIYFNVTGIVLDIVDNSQSYGFTSTKDGCCGGGGQYGLIACLPLQIPCQRRKQYVFWDSFHPSEALNTIIAKRVYSSQSPLDAYPTNLRQLAQL